MENERYHHCTSPCLAPEHQYLLEGVSVILDAKTSCTDIIGSKKINFLLLIFLKPFFWDKNLDLLLSYTSFMSIKNPLYNRAFGLLTFLFCYWFILKTYKFLLLNKTLFSQIFVDRPYLWGFLFLNIRWEVRHNKMIICLRIRNNRGLKQTLLLILQAVLSLIYSFKHRSSF